LPIAFGHAPAAGPLETVEEAMRNADAFRLPTSSKCVDLAKTRLLLALADADF
jgi:hypothetical protein